MNILKAILSLLPWQIWVGLVVISSVSGYIMHLQGELRFEKARNTTLAFAVDGMEVAADSLRNVTDEINDVLGLQTDSLRFYRRRSLQAQIERDEVAVALDASEALNARLGASIVELNTSLSAVTTEVGENRLATFEEYIRPYTVKMQVVLPPAPQLGTALVEVALDPIRLSTRVFCGARSELTGLKPAEVLIETPDWLTLSGVDVIQEPDICNPAPLEIPFHKSWKMGASVTGSVFLILGTLIFF